MKLTHIDENGNAIMVDVSAKDITSRKAIAEGSLHVCPEVFAAISDGKSKKGDILGVARVAGIMAAKNTSSLIPLCHPLPISKCTIDFETNAETCTLKAICEVCVTGRTGVEMEAITGVSLALITVYDMCKAIDKGMVLTDIHLVHKEGGKSGVYNA
ncbi:MAG: cyclic pyranopterin monophosphate synthase MoaC [Oscillospiraceae bacterium]